MPTPDETWYEFTKKMNDPNFREEVQREAMRALKLEEERRRAVQPGFKGILGDTKAAEELFGAGIPSGNDGPKPMDPDRQAMPTVHPEDAPGDVWLQIANEMVKRREVGIRRYKTAVRPFNTRDALRDLFEELLDALVYTRQTMEEKRQVNEFLEESASAILTISTRLEFLIENPKFYSLSEQVHFERLHKIAETLKRIVRNQPIEEPKPTEK